MSSTSSVTTYAAVTSASSATLQQTSWATATSSAATSSTPSSSSLSAVSTSSTSTVLSNTTTEQKLTSKEELTKFITAIIKFKELLEAELKDGVVKDTATRKQLEGFPQEIQRSLNLLQNNLKDIPLFLEEMVKECERMSDGIDAHISFIESKSADRRDAEHAKNLLEDIKKNYATFKSKITPETSQQILINAHLDSERLRLEQQLLCSQQATKDTFTATLKQIATTNSHYTVPRSCYISYALVDVKTSEEKHVQVFLAQLKADLRLAGIMAKDIQDNPGGNVNTYIANEIKAATYILVIGTPALLCEHNKGSTQLAAIEKKRRVDGRYIVPILLMGETETAFPDSFGSDYATIYKWQESSYQTNLKLLLQRLYDIGTDSIAYKDIWRSFEDSYAFLTRRLPPEAVVKRLAEEAKQQQSEQKMDAEVDEKFFQEAKSNITLQIYYLPEHTQYFTGREAQLKEIHQKLSIKNTSVITQVIVGTGGIGKTQTALRYAHEHKESYSGGIWWFNAETPEQLYSGPNGYQDLAQELGISIKESDQKTVIKMVKAKLMQKPPILLIYDNALNQKTIGEFLLSTDKAKYPQIQHRELITSRNRSPEDWGQTLLIPLPEFTIPDAVKFILDTLRTLGNKQETENSAKLLAKELGYLPLALKIAVRTIRRGSIAEYLEKYQKSVSGRKELLQKCYTNDQDGDNYRWTIFNTWQLSIDQIQLELANSHDKFTQLNQLLCYMAYLDSNAIPVKLFAETIGTDHQELIDILCDHSLLEFISNTGAYNIHQLFQEVIRIKDVEQNLELSKQRLLRLKDMLNCYYNWNKQDLMIVKQLIPHCYRLIDYLEPYAKVTKQSENPYVLAQTVLLEIVANAMENLGNDQERKEALERMLEIYKDLYGQDHFKVGEVLNKLGNVFGNLGNVQKKRECLWRALEIFKSWNVECYNIIINLSDCSMDDRDSAEKIEAQLQFILKVCEDVDGINSPRMCVILTKLGRVAGYLGNNQGSKDYFERAFNIAKNIYDPESEAYAIALANLGEACNKLGYRNDGIKYLRNALEILKRRYGDKHQAVAIILVNLGEVLSDVEGKGMLLEALEIDKKKWGEESPQVASTLSSLGNVLGSLGDKTGQEDAYEKALRIMRNSEGYGASHSLTKKIITSMQAANIPIPQDCLDLIATQAATQQATANANISTTESKETRNISSTILATSTVSTSESLQSFQTTAAASFSCVAIESKSATTSFFPPGRKYVFVPITSASSSSLAATVTTKNSTTQLATTVNNSDSHLSTTSTTSLSSSSNGSASGTTTTLADSVMKQ